VSGEIATGGATAAAEAGGGDFGSCTGAANVPGRTDVSGEIATGGCETRGCEIEQSSKVTAPKEWSFIVPTTFRTSPLFKSDI
jgi:hypothetical protein